MDTPDVSTSLPGNIENYTLSANLNSFVLLSFLMGIYTMVYGGTVYLYAFKKPLNTNNRFVLSVISLLYVLCFLGFIFQWYLNDWTFLTNGATRESVFQATQGGMGWVNPITHFLGDFSFVVPDLLLVWRCYHLWGQSFKVIAIPSLLLVAEFALAVTDIALNAVFPNTLDDNISSIEGTIETTLVFLSLGTTLSITFLIAYKIHTATKSIAETLTPSTQRPRYTRIVAIVVESSAVYALLLMLFALTVVVPQLADNLTSPVCEVGYYVQEVVAVASGMVPTVMVARLAITNNSSTDAVSANTMSHISAVNFGNSQQTSGVNSGIGSANTPDGSRGGLDSFVHDEDVIDTRESEEKATKRDSGTGQGSA